MKKIIILSDTHLDNGEIPAKVRTYVTGADYLLHAGDIRTLSAYNALIELANLTTNKESGLKVVKGSEDIDINLQVLKPIDAFLVEGVRIGLKHEVLKEKDSYFTDATELADNATDWSECECCVFRWNEIPGKDDARLKEFLRENLGIDWVKNAKIEKIDADKTIKVSAKEKSLSLKLNNDKTKVILKVEGLNTEELIAKMENNERKIYYGFNYGVDVLVFGHVSLPIIANGKKLFVCPGHSSNIYTAEVPGSIPTMAQLIIRDGFVYAAIIPLDGSLHNNIFFAKFRPHYNLL
jgi:predicted phosphodiesterase